MRINASALVVFVTLFASGRHAIAQCQYPIDDLAACKNRTARASHTPGVSNPPCGPEGFPGIIPQGSGAASYVAACSAHDICYDTCNSSKALCDAAFEPQMRSSCFNAYPNADADHEEASWRGVCLSRARLFANKVKDWGQGAYDAAQKRACECCDSWSGTATVEAAGDLATTVLTADVTWHPDGSPGIFRTEGTVTAEIIHADCTATIVPPSHSISPNDGILAVSADSYTATATTVWEATVTIQCPDSEPAIVNIPFSLPWIDVRQAMPANSSDLISGHLHDTFTYSWEFRRH